MTGSTLIRLVLAGSVLVFPVDATVASTPEPAGCSELPQWTYDASHRWPPDGSLLRPEDGTCLPDGRVLVSDEAFGLRVIDAHGRHRPFGELVDRGYAHSPPDFPGGATGVCLENDGRHVLVGDVYTGRIYRVDVETEATSVIYDHPWGINSIEQDSRGTLWFTQSARNTDAEGADGLARSLELPIATGGVYTLARAGPVYSSTARQAIAGLHFANGIAIDAREVHLYVAELMMDRVLRYRLDVSTASVSCGEVYQRVATPDNLAMDSNDNLWIASLLANEIVVVDAACWSVSPVFRAHSRANRAALDEWAVRAHAGDPRLDLLGPDSYRPLPGFLTGMFWCGDGSTVYLTGLGDSILRYPLR